jgi:Inner membrane protein YgaP-like, transmembrane domain
MSALNVGNLDRALRILIGVLLTGLAASGTIGAWGYLGGWPRCAPSTGCSACRRPRAESLRTRPQSPAFLMRSAIVAQLPIWSRHILATAVARLSQPGFGKPNCCFQ